MLRLIWVVAFFFVLAITASQALCAEICTLPCDTDDDTAKNINHAQFIIAHNNVSIPMRIAKRYEGRIDTRSNMNIEIWSQDDREFDAKLWTSNGKVLQYRTNIIKTKGKIDYIVFENRYDTPIDIVLEFTKIEKKDLIDQHTVLAIGIAMILIWHDRKSVYVKAALTAYLAYQMYMWTYVYPKTDVEIDDRVFKKFMF